MSKEFVDAIKRTDNLEAENAFKLAMTTKVGDALQIKRRGLAQTFVNQWKQEDQEADVNETD